MTVVPAAMYLDEQSARRLTDEVRADAEALYRKLVQLYEGQAHSALGYPSWYAYCEAEFGFGRSQSYRMLDAGRVVAAVPQLGNEAQARALAPLFKDDTAAAIEVFERLQTELASEGRIMTARDIRVAVSDYIGRKNRRKRNERLTELRDTIRNEEVLEYAREHDCGQFEAEEALGFRAASRDPDAQWIVCPRCSYSKAAWATGTGMEYSSVGQLLEKLDGGGELDRDSLLRILTSLRSTEHGRAIYVRKLERDLGRLRRQVKKLEERLADA